MYRLCLAGGALFCQLHSPFVGKYTEAYQIVQLDIKFSLLTNVSVFAQVEEVPTVARVSAVVEYLKTLGLVESDLPRFVKAFPQIFGCDMETVLAENVELLQNKWKLKGSVLTGALKRRPPILGYVVDCEGSCVGECNRCWVRF